MTETFGIPMAFVIISALTLWVVLGCRGHWFLKMVMVSASIFFSILLWNSLVSLQGYPASAQMPDKFEVKWVDVEEPNKKTGDPGSIRVWAKDIAPKPSDQIKLHQKEMSGDPRVYELPYSRQMHEQCQGIKKQIAGGKRYFGQMGAVAGKMGEMGQGKKGDGKGGGKKGSGRKGNGKLAADGNGRGGSFSQEQEMMFYELPPPVFPEKDYADDSLAAPPLSPPVSPGPSGVAP